MDYEAKYRKYLRKYQLLLKQRGSATAERATPDEPFPHEEVMNLGDIPVTEVELDAPPQFQPIGAREVQAIRDQMPPLENAPIVTGTGAAFNGNTTRVFLEGRALAKEAVRQGTVHPYPRPLGVTRGGKK